MSEKRAWSSLSPSPSDNVTTEKRPCTDETNASFLYDETTVIEEQLSSTRVDSDSAGVHPSADRKLIRDEVRAALQDKTVLLRIADVIGGAVCERISGQIAELKEEIKKKDKQIEELSTKLDDLEQYTRRNSLRIAGVPEEKDESTDGVVMSVFKAIGVELPVSAIDRCHRIGRPPSTTSSLSPSPSPRSIIVKLVSYRDKDAILRSRKLLKDKRARDIMKTRDGGNNRIFINEDLTANRSKLAAEARRLMREKKLDNTWTKDGAIFLKKGNSIIKATSFKDMPSA